MEFRRAFSALIVWSADSSCATEKRLTSRGGGSPIWPIRPKVVATACRNGLAIPPPHGTGSAIGPGHGPGSTTGVGNGTGSAIGPGHRRCPQAPYHHGAGSTTGDGIGRGYSIQPPPPPPHGGGSTTAPPGGVNPPAAPGCCAKTASKRVNRSSILFRLSSVAMFTSVAS